MMHGSDFMHWAYHVPMISHQGETKFSRSARTNKGSKIEHAPSFKMRRLQVGNSLKSGLVFEREVSLLSQRANFEKKGQ